MRRRLSSDELVGEVIDVFLADYPFRMAAIKLAVETRDNEGIRTASHALRGAAGNLVAAPIVERLRALETMAMDGTVDPRVTDAAWLDLEAEALRLTTALRDANVRSGSLKP
jgi:HPt (histidine-containing phosphotransfer) domain-containing protein